MVVGDVIHHVSPSSSPLPFGILQIEEQEVLGKSACLLANAIGGVISFSMHRVRGRSAHANRLCAIAANASRRGRVSSA